MLTESSISQKTKKAGKPKHRLTPRSSTNYSPTSNRAEAGIKRLHEITSSVRRGKASGQNAYQLIIEAVAAALHAECGVLFIRRNERFDPVGSTGLKGHELEELSRFTPAFSELPKSEITGVETGGAKHPALGRWLDASGFGEAIVIPITVEVFAGCILVFQTARIELLDWEKELAEIYGELAGEVIEREGGSERELSKVENRFQILSKLPAAVYACDAEGRITLFNKAAVQLWGRVPERGRDLWCGSWKIYTPDGTPLALSECPMAKAIQEGESIRGREIIIEKPDGTRNLVLPHPETIRDEQGKIIGALNVLVDISDFSEARRASQQLAAIVQSSEDAIVSKNLNGVIQTWNRGAEKLFGYTAEEVIGKPVTILIPENQQDEEPAILGKIRSGERIEHYETIRKRKDGTLVNVSLSVSPIYDPTGKIMGASKIARNITEQKRAERVLSRRTHHLEVVNRTGAMLAAELDLNRLIQKVTDVATELSGAKFGAFFYNRKNDKGEDYLLYTLSGAPREAFDKFGHPRNTAIFGPTFRGERVVRYEDVTESPNYGQNPPFHGMPEGHLPVRSYLAVPVISRTGKVLGGLFFGHPDRGVFTEESENIVTGIAGQAAVAMDNATLYRELRKELAEHKRAEVALRESEFQFRLLTELLPQMVWTTDAAGELQYFNRRWIEFTGFEPKGDRSWHAIVHEDDLRRTLEAWNHALASGNAFQNEVRYRKQNGCYRWFLARAFPVRDEKGRILKWVGTSTDIDDQKRAEEKLEKTIQERTAKLRETVTELEAFSYSIAHDMRAPLRAMSGFSMLLEEDYGELLPEEAKGYLTRITKSAGRLDRLIQDVLNYSRISRGEMPLQSTDVEQLIREIVDSYPHLRSSALELQIDGPLPLVLANSAALTQCISNILTNAVKFVPPGTRPRVRVRSERRDLFARIWFEDNGIGISEEGKKRIFNMFQRLHGSDDFEGTGIGLTIVRKAVERMGGRVGVESNVGEGSRFWLELQLAN